MLRYLIDANLPYRFSLWRGDAFLHVFERATTARCSPAYRQYAIARLVQLSTADLAQG